MKKDFSIIAGIDVSSKKLDYTIIKNRDDKKHLQGVVSNDQKGLAKLTSLFLKNGVSKVILENTGVYSMPVCYHMQKASISYSMVSPLEIKRSQGINRGKSDKADAKDIAFYGITHEHKLIATKLPAEDLLKLKLALAEREKLVKAITTFKTTKINKEYLSIEIVKSILALNKKTIQALRKQLDAIDELIQGIIDANETFKQQQQLLLTVPGVGKQTASNLIATTNAFENFKDWRKYACYCGVAPFEYSSGSSIRGRTKVSHLANKKMKSLLNMAALSAKKYDKEIATYYQRKLNEGKNAMLVLNAIRCKVISRAFAVIKRKSPFVDTLKAVA